MYYRKFMTNRKSCVIIVHVMGAEMTREKNTRGQKDPVQNDQKKRPGMKWPRTKRRVTDNVSPRVARWSKSRDKSSPSVGHKHEWKRPVHWDKNHLCLIPPSVFFWDTFRRLGLLGDPVQVVFRSLEGGNRDRFLRFGLRVALLPFGLRSGFLPFGLWAGSLSWKQLVRDDEILKWRFNNKVHKHSSKQVIL
jgi:hypothetical protein